MSSQKHLRIKAACQELEQALVNFEDDSQAKETAKKETKKIREIKKRLDEIKAQLEQFDD